MLNDLLVHLHKNFLYLRKPKCRFSCIVGSAQWIAHPQMLIANIAKKFKKLAIIVNASPLWLELGPEKV